MTGVQTCALPICFPVTIKEKINAAIAETGATGPQQMGLVMKSIQPKIAGRADGGVVSSLVKAALSGGN